MGKVDVTVKGAYATSSSQAKSKVSKKSKRSSKVIIIHEGLFLHSKP